MLLVFAELQFFDVAEPGLEPGPRLHGTALAVWPSFMSVTSINARRAGRHEGRFIVVAPAPRPAATTACPAGWTTAHSRPPAGAGAASRGRHYARPRC